MYVLSILSCSNVIYLHMCVSVCVYMCVAAFVSHSGMYKNKYFLHDFEVWRVQ